MSRKQRRRARREQKHLRHEERRLNPKAMSQDELRENVTAFVKRRRWLRGLANGLKWPLLANLAVAIVTLIYVGASGANPGLGIDVFAPHLIKFDSGPDSQVSLGGMWVALNVGLIIVTRLARRASRGQLILTKYIDMTNVASVPALIHALELTEPEVITEAQNALANLLPQMTRDDLDMLTPENRETLRVKFATAPADLQRGILVIWEVTGDSFDNGVLHYMLSNGKTTDLELLSSIEQCSKVVEERVARENASQRLLRPAHSGGEDALLRPASGVGHVVEENLLRPAIATDDPIHTYDTAPKEAETVVIGVRSNGE